MRLLGATAGLGVAAALLLPRIPAQGGLHSPTRLASVEGQYFSYLFGAWPKVRYQMVDGENRGTAAQLKAIAFRLDHRNHSSRSTAVGRTWPRVTLDLAEGDLGKSTNDFAKNRATTPTRVFSGAVTWPDFDGTPLSRPDLWGGIGGDYRLPFQSGWSYSGNLDIVSDWDFDGGVLANAATWTSALKGYWFDSYHDPEEPRTGTYREVPAQRLHNDSPNVTGRCNDSFFGSQTTGSYARIFARAYGPDASQPAWRDNLLIWSSSHYTAPGAPVVHAWAFAVDDRGLDLRTGCNNLHLLGLTLFFTHLVPGTSNPSGSMTTTPIFTGWVPGLSSLRVALQAGWGDSVNGELRLSQAHEVVLPIDRPPPAPRRAAIYQEPLAPVRGPDRSYVTNPAIRYDR